MISFINREKEFKKYKLNGIIFHPKESYYDYFKDSQYSYFVNQVTGQSCDVIIINLTLYLNTIAYLFEIIKANKDADTILSFLCSTNLVKGFEHEEDYDKALLKDESELRRRAKLLEHLNMLLYNDARILNEKKKDKEIDKIYSGIRDTLKGMHYELSLHDKLYSKPEIKAIETSDYRFDTNEKLNAFRNEINAIETTDEKLSFIIDITGKRFTELNYEDKHNDITLRECFSQIYTIVRAPEFVTTISSPVTNKEIKVKASSLPSINQDYLEEIFNSLKIYFDANRHDDLRQLLKTSDTVNEKLIFRGSGKTLAYYFKELMRHRVLNIPVQKHLEKWIMDNFMFVNRKNYITEFKERYADKIISGNEMPSEGHRIKLPATLEKNTTKH